MKKILIVDDEKPIVEIIKFNLLKENYFVISSYDGLDAVERVYKDEIDLIILDLMLPGKDGFDVIREIRKKYNIPIIIVSAKNSKIDTIIGLELGADDYITKPFSNRELIARVKVNLRREIIKKKKNFFLKDDLKIGNLIIKPNSYIIIKNKKEIKLTNKEFELFYYLAKFSGIVISRERLLEKVWGYDFFGDVRTVDVTIRRLREKIEEKNSEPKYLITRHGVGYYVKKF